MSAEDFRRQTLSKLSTDDRVVQELLRYNQNSFDVENTPSPSSIPLQDEPFVDVWQGYLAEAEDAPIYEVLKQHLVQLNFPVTDGMSVTEAYRRVTRRGESLEGHSLEAAGLAMEASDALRVEVVESAAGRIAVITPAVRADFLSLLRALTMKNEPVEIPDSQGACMIAGYPNWDRINRYRREFERENSVDSWPEEFKSFSAQKELYQDRLILLSSGNYSGVTAQSIGLPEDEWKRKSWQIRLAHECAHYFTRRVFDSMQNRLFDELISDCVGILAAEGRYRADWFLHFMGLESFPDYRAGGRLQNYRGDPGLSDEAFRILLQLVVKAARNLETFLAGSPEDLTGVRGQALVIVGLSFLTVEELAAEQAEDLLQTAFDKALRWLPGDVF